MTSPYFSIAIPTKNRPEALHDSIKGVLDQTFDDLEVVVCDNSDSAEAAGTADVAAAFDDPRIRYVRTSGDLSMPDNWEHAVAATRGEYAGVLTDRSVLRPRALEIIQTEIQRTGAPCVSWFGDLYGRDESASKLKRRGSTLRRYRLESASLLHYFLNGEAKYATKVIPKLMTAVCHRSILEEIRSSPIGRCCPPVCPDFTSGLLILAHTDWVLTIDESLYVSCGHGTGFAFRSRGELGEQFRRDLGMTWAEMVDRMPTEACFSHALVLNDLMRLRDALPERFADLALNRAQYYIGCLNDYAKAASRGTSERDDDFYVLLQALAGERSAVRTAVEGSRSYRRAETLAALTPAERAARAEEKRTRPDEDEDTESFGSVFEAIAWDEANPREPSESGLLDIVAELGSDAPCVVDTAFPKRGRSEPNGASGAARPPETVRSRLRLRTRLRAALGKTPA